MSVTAEVDDRAPLAASQPPMVASHVVFSQLVGTQSSVANSTSSNNSIRYIREPEIDRFVADGQRASDDHHRNHDDADGDDQWIMNAQWCFDGMTSKILGVERTLFGMSAEV